MNTESTGCKTSARIVAVGASAGGIETSKELLRQLPAESGLAFVFVFHLDAKHVSSLASILGGTTTMSVVDITQGMVPCANTVFVIPSRVNVSLSQGCFLLEEAEIEGYRPINYFFSSLAQELGTESVGIVLSGFGDDGSNGLKDIRKVAGITFAQQPESAFFRDMPANAIEGGNVDHILTVNEIATQLLGIVNRSNDNIASTDIEDIDQDKLQEILARVKNYTGHDLSLYREGTIKRRIRHRMNLKHISHVEAYLTFLDNNSMEIQELFNDLLIGVTSFFRDPDVFGALSRALQSRKVNYDAIRIWIPGCSTGEEAYSIAMIVLEESERIGKITRAQIFATDLDADAIRLARSGIYSKNIEKQVSKERLQRFFVREGDFYRVSKVLRQLVVFSEHNMAQDPPFSRIDVISCRNVFIYFDQPLQEHVLNIFHYALASEGLLILGSLEGVGQTQKNFRLLDRKYRIFEKKDAALNLRSVLTGPWRATNISGESFTHPVAELYSTNAIVEGARNLLEKKYIPSSVVINSDNEVVSFLGKRGNYIETTNGTPTLNILQIVNDNVKVELRSAISAARRSQEPVSHRCCLMRNGIETVYNILVSPLFKHTATNNEFLCVTFESELVVDLPEAPAADLQEDGKPFDSSLRDNESNFARIELLHGELNRVRESYRILVEELDRTSAEQQAANHELVSNNEEIRATTEELQTSKEELQSVNEELETLNQQLGSKVELLDISNNDLRNFLSCTGIATVFLDSNMHIRRFTPSMTSVINLIPGDVGRPLTHLSTRLKNPNFLQNIESVLLSRTSAEWEVEADDNRWLLMRAVPYTTESNPIDGVTVSFFDITYLKKVEHDLKEARDLAEAANHSKSQFLANMSHEIRTPMNAVIGLTSILLNDDLSVQQKEWLSLVRVSAGTLLNLINDLLDISKIEANRMSLNIHDFNLWQLLDDVGKLAKYSLDEKNLGWELDLPRNVPVMLRGDLGRLQQILSNLITNAIKFTEKGKVSLRVEVVSSEHHYYQLKFFVSDTGLGVPAEMISSLFQPFVQVDATMGRRYGGTGLGLAICKELVHRMDGEIGVTSQLGVGSSFWFTVRLEPGAAPLLTPLAALQLEAAPTNLEHLHGAIRILVVEDNPVGQLVTKIMLQQLGQQADVANDGYEALVMLRQDVYDLVFMDCQMPGMDGMEATRLIRAASTPVKNHQIIVVALTAHAMKIDHEKCLAAGMDDFLSKPAPLASLAAILSKWMKIIAEKRNSHTVSQSRD